MDAVLHQLRILAGGLICGAAFMVVVLAIAGQL
jgi:hypothetical protein